jgi:hypothetical protein
VAGSVQPRIRELLKAYPRIPATVIGERIGWQHGLTVVRASASTHRNGYGSTCGEPGSEFAEFLQCVTEH